MKLSQNPDVIVERLEVSPFIENTYILGNKVLGKCVLIDPGDDPEKIMRAVSFNGLAVEKILLTHGHLDHVAGCGDIKKMTGCSIGIHRLDEEMYMNATRQGAILGMPAKDQPPPDFYLEGGDKIDVAGLELSIVHTPGHTAGSICLITGDMVFCGDLIFAGSIGRTDLPGGSFQTLIDSVVEKVFTLDDDIVLLPGHGPRTTVGFEKKYNPFFA